MAQTVHWEIYVIEFARSKNQPWVDLVNGMYEDGPTDLPFSFVLARRGDRNVLVDTGFMKDETGPNFSDKFGIPWWISPVRMLAELGLAPGDITDIIVSHAHFDHMGSIDQFPNARLYLQKQELLSWHEAMALPPQYGYLTAIIDPDDLRAAFDASVEHRLTLVDGDRDDLLPGIHVRLGQGHTMGQQFVIVETSRGRIVLSGDCVYSSRQITGHKHDGVYQPLNNAVGSVWDQLKTIDRINTEIGGNLDRLIILHDSDRWKGLPVIKEIEGFRIVKAA
ncbi:N-acyl homoserine lactonase family protein [Mesorhizobium sp. M7A.F.Ca.CA.001.09.2.1]|jgi:glyoxylase-like metal-dependent hydrolase (beta-lactamase superfamily II)|uniref:N-acyl homoserine lactonase family protein n=2 Tax=Mesorhizobium TaxID=68287 RepID=A0AB38T9G8_9HYPH|nr:MULTISPECIES: N-acyl homoserine lactonase family protein [Mesorhizobium]RUY59416.1 N-acyl homoserine lactonase family protein [Mesorhizobium sp. M7A.F.Ca.CA.001.13.2.1]MDF3214408.1 N-acyl homoserine lactonase family protein [Mesorhizobium ciceri]RUY65687.1 N-acyl homoserine lactonase family protein [Mesorhizobium sp. M7A.F.Ca.CA.001.09.2.1]RUY70166.1 N-acyl homoserine lactonase family protein [Mesorhizobium sp. M7A.F.Ca.CA.001.13.1.1]RUY70317.1 N-acyl homoserine lactonase family protein [Me